MADRVRFSVYATPLETLTDENGGTLDKIASEVGRSVGGSGDSVDVANYSGTAANQGYKDAAVNYLGASYADGGTALSATATPDFIFIKNTGYKFSSATVLGASTTDCVSVCIRVNANASPKPGWVNGSDTGEIHYFEIAWLKPGQAIVLPLGGNIVTGIGATWGGNDNDYNRLQSSSSTIGDSYIYVRTFQSDGTDATVANAIEYLVVT